MVLGPALGTSVTHLYAAVAPLLAAGIRSVFESGSVSTLLNGLPEDMRPRNIYA